MHSEITLSKRSKELIVQVFELLGDQTLQEWHQQPVLNEVDRVELIEWLSEDISSDSQSRFLLESLRASLLEDLHDSFLSEEELARKREKKVTPWWAKVQFALLALAGTIVAICEGFDGIASILAMFNSVPAVAVLGAGLFFSVLSVVVFYGFDLIAISSNVGVRLSSSPKLIDLLLNQVEQIETIKTKIQLSYAHATTHEDLLALKATVNMLMTRFQALDEDRENYQAALNNSYLNAAKSIIAAITGILFFGGGFFSGQSLALAIVGLFVTAPAVTLLPVFLTSLGVGLAALSIYWYVERPGLENLVGQWCGLDKDNIDKLADEEIVSKHTNALVTLEGSIESRLDELSTIRINSAVMRWNEEVKQPAVNRSTRGATNRSGPGFFHSVDDLGVHYREPQLLATPEPAFF